MLVAHVLVNVGVAAAVLIAAIPLAAVVAPILLSRGQPLIFGAVFALPLSGLAVLSQPLPLGGASLFPQDIILGLAVASWAFGKLVLRESYPPVPYTPVFGWPFVLFAAAIVVAVIRGNAAYGATLYGQPTRIVAYAAIVTALAGVSVEMAYRVLRNVLYVGVVLTMGWAVYYIATDGSQTDQIALSTGGERILAIQTSLFCAATLFLALLSLRLTPASGGRALHLVMAALGFFGVVLGFGRAVFAGAAVICFLILVLSAPVRSAVVSMLPLAAPFIALTAVFVGLAAPSLINAAVDRVTATSPSDANVQWRIEANKSVMAQIREQPVFGVGFGRESEFYFYVESDNGALVPFREVIKQDPHNGYMYILSGAGFLALTAFFLVVVRFARDAVRRYRSSADPKARLLVLWAAATLSTFLLSAASGFTFVNPVELMPVWALLTLPAVVRPTEGFGHDDPLSGRSAEAHRPTV